MKIAASHRILAIAGLCAAALVGLVINEGFAVPYHGEDKAVVANWCAILSPSPPVNLVPAGF